MATIAGVSGRQLLSNHEDYHTVRYQYATSSHDADADNHMRPGLIVQAKNKEDIKLVIAHATAHGKAIAIRSGGHQYSGASSTGSDNIQLDLRDTFKSPSDIAYMVNGDKSYVRTSVSWSLGEFNTFLGKHKAFSPHGQCVSVHVGGHCQTGGFGQIARSFGLLGDYIQSFEIIDHAGQEREITRHNDPDMFFAWAGGSPGNLGVLTHFTLEVFRDEDYEGSMGLRSIHLYSKEKMKRLFQILAEMADDDDFPRNYDLCLSVLSSNFDVMSALGGLDKEMRLQHPEVFGKNGEPKAWPCMIIVYAQWVPFNKDDKPDMAWFKRLSHGAWLQPGVQKKPMSQLMAEWIWGNTREFDLPYVKTSHLTTRNDLSTNGWVDWLADRLDMVIGHVGNGQWISSQYQAYGGKHSRFRANADGSTAYSWRDSTLGASIDNFHLPSKKQDAQKWSDETMAQAVGPDGIFSTEDRRSLWASFGEFDMHSVRAAYHETEEKYKRLQKARLVADPHGVFTPNSFCVKRASPTDSSE